MTRLLALFLIFTGPALANDALWKQVQDARRDGELPTLTAEDQHLARVLFRDLSREVLVGQISPQIRTRASALGLHVRVEEEHVMVWGREAAHGLFVFRLGSATEAILQAPHSFYDLGSGQLVARLFDQMQCRAAFFNSAHRYGSPGLSPEERPDPPGPDLAHRADTLYQAATLGSSEALGGLTVIRIHGFKAREDESAVITTGSALQPSHISRSLHTQISSLFQDIGPVVTAAARPELAGRKNVQGRILSSQSPFIHLELAKDTRDQLIADDALLAELAAALQEVKP